MTSINVSAAPAELPKLIDAVIRGEEVTLTRHGMPVAVLVRPDRLRSRRAEAALADAAEIGRLVATGRTQPLSNGGGLAPGRADELVAEIRADRSRR
ncbi:MAG: type II toxin-antitoxin system Phd/YefM family antitoxin [Microthrixaceae bacterium]